MFEPKHEGLYSKMEPLFKGAVRSVGAAWNRVQGSHTPSGWVAPGAVEGFRSLPAGLRFLT